MELLLKEAQVLICEESRFLLDSIEFLLTQDIGFPGRVHNMAFSLDSDRIEGGSNVKQK